jgi:hypothetical protein
MFGCGVCDFRVGGRAGARLIGLSGLGEVSGRFWCQEKLCSGGFSVRGGVQAGGPRSAGLLVNISENIANNDETLLRLRTKGNHKPKQTVS